MKKTPAYLREKQAPTIPWKVGELVRIHGEGSDRFQIIEVYADSVLARNLDNGGTECKSFRQLERLGVKFPPYEKVETILAALPVKK